MSNITTLRFGWDFESTQGLEAVHLFTTFLDIFCAIPVHLWVLLIVTLKPRVLRTDIRRSYIADQVTMMLYGLVMCILLKPYPTFPWPGCYCAGILCQLNLDGRLIAATLGATFSSVVPFFCYLMIRLHNQVIFGTGTKFNITGWLQLFLMIAIMFLLVCNTVCFGLFAVDAANVESLQELAYLTSRTGRVIVIGPPGDAGNFRYEVALLFLTCSLVVLLLVFLTVHSLYIIYNRDNTLLSHKTHQAQDRLVLIFFLQIFAVFLFFVVPMLTWVFLTTVDTSSWTDRELIALRSSIIISLSLKPLAQSLIFLGKNPALRKQALIRVRRMLYKGCVASAN